MDRKIRVGVGGALGRMGRAIAEVAQAHEGVELVARFGRPSAEGSDGGGVVLSSRARALEACDVIIDFSTGAASAALAEAAAAANGPALVLGATGLGPTEEAAVAHAAESVAIVKSGNFSMGVALLRALVEQAARRLGPDWDIEVFEAHHRHKRDAPSGTALLLGAAAARGRGLVLADVQTGPGGRDGAPRREGDIGFSVMRAGGLAGEHSVIFAAADEVVVLAHSARDRRLFARGALEAALWVSGRTPGLYDMTDVLGLEA